MTRSGVYEIANLMMRLYAFDFTETKLGAGDDMVLVRSDRLQNHKPASEHSLKCLFLINELVFDGSARMGCNDNKKRVGKVIVYVNRDIS